VWTLATDRSVYVVERADGTRNSVVTILLDDLDAPLRSAAAAQVGALGLLVGVRLPAIRGLRL
jgi:hypothetical protein